MRRLTAILLFLLLPLCAEANIRFGAGGVVNFVSPVSFGYRPTPAAPAMSGDVSATMTSDIEPSPNVATASSRYSASYLAFKALDGNTSTFWYSYVLPTSGPSWLQYYFGSGNGHKIIKFRIYLAGGSTSYLEYQFQGSSDGTNFTDLASSTIPYSVSGKWTDVTFTNDTTYEYYRLYITGTYNDSNDYPAIYELELWEQ